MAEAPNLIDLLNRVNPSLLSSLRARHPSQPQLFSSERFLGDEKVPPTTFESDKRAAMVDLISSSLADSAAALDSLSKEVRKVMKRVSVLRLVGSLIAIISGGLSGILAIKFNRSDAQAITAFAAMLGGVVAGAADHFERAPSGVRLASAEQYGKIIEMRSNIELIRLKIQRDKVLPASDYDLQNMLTQLDQYAKEVAVLKIA